MRRMIRNLAVLFPRGVIRWLLRDEFSDTRAAGAVDGTPATPGPGTRTVQDPDGVVSISGGNYVSAGGSTVFAQNIYYPAITRVAGTVLVAIKTSTLTAGRDRIGFHGAESGCAASTFVGFYGSDFSVDAVAAELNVQATPATATGIVAVVLGTAGGYHFCHTSGGWLLIYSNRRDATATLYPCITLDRSLETHGWIRIPAERWLPTPAAFDSFSRADGALGVSEIWGPDNQTVTARVWNNRVGTTLVATTAAQASALVGGIAIATVNTGTVNAITGATLTRAGNEVGVVLRYVNADNYIRAIHDGTNCKLVKRVAAAETDVISAVMALGAGAIRVIPDGTAFRLFLNDAAVGVVSTINDAVLQTGTEQGLFSTNVGNTQDRFLVMARGSNGEYAALNKWSF